MDRDLVSKVRRLDEYELRRLLILVRGLLLHLDGPPGEEEPSLPKGLSYRQESVKCGKPACTRCPHGPYWYAYWKEDGRTRKRYIGRHLPGEQLEEVTPDLPSSASAPQPNLPGAPSVADPGPPASDRTVAAASADDDPADEDPADEDPGDRRPPGGPDADRRSGQG